MATTQKDNSGTSTTTQKDNSGTSAQSVPKKKKREDFHFGKLLGEGSYSTVSPLFIFVYLIYICLFNICLL